MMMEDERVRRSCTALFGAAALLGLAGAVVAADPTASIEKVAVSARRHGLELRAVGKASGVEKLVARVRKGEAVAFETPCAVQGGDFRAEIVVEQPLLPDSYELEVLVPGGASLAKRPFQVGTEADVKPARERLLAWLRGARGALRDLAVVLEKRGRYHLAQLEAIRKDDKHDASAKGRAVSDSNRAWAQFLDQFDEKYRAARMDFHDYEREVALSPYPEAGKRLAGLFPLLQKRREVLVRAFDDALRSQPVTLAPPREILDLGHAASLALDEKEPDMDRWSPGALAEPEDHSFEGGLYVSKKLGFQVTPPAGFQPQVSILDPDVRVRFSKDDDRDVLLMVRVVDGVEATDDAAFERFSEFSAWEGFSSYRRLEGHRLEEPRDGYQRVVTATQQGKHYKILQTDLFAGRRIFALLCIAPPEKFDRVREECEKAAATFKLVTR